MKVETLDEKVKVENIVSKSESEKDMMGRERSGRACIRRHYRALTWREGGRWQLTQKSESGKYQMKKKK